MLFNFMIILSMKFLYFHSNFICPESRDTPVYLHFNLSNANISY